MAYSLLFVLISLFLIKKQSTAQLDKKAKTLTGVGVKILTIGKSGEIMKNNIFGNLNDWGIVLDKLEKLSENRELGNYQGEIIRLLRFDQNWRLREAAIESLAFVENPGLDLARELPLLIRRKDIYYDVRILATDSLEKLVAIMVSNKTVDKDILKQFIFDITKDLDALLASPEPPKFHDALQSSADKIKKIMVEL